MKYSICIETIYTEQLFEKRIKSVRDADFDYCEFWSWQNKDLDKISKYCKKYDIKIGSFSGDDEYSMISSKENTDYIDFVKQSINMAKILNCPYLVIHSDALCEDGSAKVLIENISYDKKIENIYEALSKLKPIAEKEKVCLVLEPLNTSVDHPEYFLDSSKTVFDIIKRIDSEYIKVLYDVYHMQIMEGNIIDCLMNNIDLIGYIHIADVPGRHEPGTGELNYNNIIKALNELKYNGIIGFELMPKYDSETAINRIKKLMI